MRTTLSGAVGALALLAASTACSSERVMLVTRPPANYEVLGRTHGEATGSILILGTLTNFIPAYLNSRTESAVNRALRAVPGATGMVNVTIQEDWYWYYLGSAKVVKVSGDAIRERR